MAVADSRVDDLAAIASQLGQWREPLQLTPGADAMGAGCGTPAPPGGRPAGWTVLLPAA